MLKFKIIVLLLVGSLLWLFPSKASAQQKSTSEYYTFDSCPKETEDFQESLDCRIKTLAEQNFKEAYRIKECQIRASKDLAPCIDELVETSGRADFCLVYGDYGQVRTCVVEAAIDQKSIEPCSVMKGPGIQDACILSANASLKDVKNCFRMSDPKRQEECVFYLPFTKEWLLLKGKTYLRYLLDSGSAWLLWGGWLYMLFFYFRQSNIDQWIIGSLIGVIGFIFVISISYIWPIKELISMYVYPLFLLEAIVVGLRYIIENDAPFMINLIPIYAFLYYLLTSKIRRKIKWIAIILLLLSSLFTFIIAFIQAMALY